MPNDPSDMPPISDSYPSDMPPPLPSPYPAPVPPDPLGSASYAGGAPTMVAPPPMAPRPMTAAAPTGDSGGGLAVTGLIFAIVAMLVPLLALFAAFGRFPGLTVLLLIATIPVAIIGIVLSAVGRSSVRRHGSATAGLVLGIVALVLAVGVLLFTVAFARGAAGPGRFRGPQRRFVPQGTLQANPVVYAAPRADLWV